jgi:hypothetical protein
MGGWEDGRRGRVWIHDFKNIFMMNGLTWLKFFYLGVKCFLNGAGLVPKAMRTNIFMPRSPLSNATGAVLPRIAIIFAEELGPQPANVKQTLLPLRSRCSEVHAQ